jgi:hypothetical protein
MSEQTTIKPAIEYMNDLCSWTIDEGAPPFDERWTKRLALASDLLSAKDATIAQLRAAVGRLEGERQALAQTVDAMRWTLETIADPANSHKRDGSVYIPDVVAELACDALKKAAALAADERGACPACGTLPEEPEHDPTCPLFTADH